MKRIGEIGIDINGNLVKILYEQRALKRDFMPQG